MPGVLPESAQPYDFGKLDRIPKDQFRALHQLQEDFARLLAPSLSAYLRAPVTVNPVGVDELPSPTTIVVIGMQPSDRKGLLEISSSLVFPVLELLLGGSGKLDAPIKREITEIERSVLEGFFDIVLRDLTTAWRTVATLKFSAEKPQLLQLLAPQETVVAVSVEVSVGQKSGRMNIAIPQGSVGKARATPEEQARMLRLIRPAPIRLEARLQGPKLRVASLLDLKAGDVLVLDYPVDRPVDVLVNGNLKYRAEVTTSGRKRAFEVLQLFD